MIDLQSYNCIKEHNITKIEYFHLIDNFCNFCTDSPQLSILYEIKFQGTIYPKEKDKDKQMLEIIGMELAISSSYSSSYNASNTEPGKELTISYA